MSVQIDGSTGNIIAIKADYSGDVSIGGTLTYEDVTNIDAVGLITARNGIKVDDLGVQVATGATIDGATNTLTFLTNGSERLRITSAGEIQTKTRSAGVRRMILSGSPSNDAFNIEAHDGVTGTSSGDVQGKFGLFYNDGSTLTNAANISFERGSGAADGAMAFVTNQTERLRITSTGKMGLGETSPLGQFHIKTGDSGASSVGASADEFVIEGSANSGMTILSGTTGQGLINFGDSDDLNVGNITYDHSANFMSFKTGDAERAQIDSSGRLLVGTSSSPAGVGGYGRLSPLVVQGYTGASTSGGYMSLQRGETASNTSSGDEIGILSFNDSAGFTFGQIRCHADGTPGSSDYPGRLSFFTTVDGASSPTERMRIDSSGIVNVGTVTIPYGFHYFRANSTSETLGAFYVLNDNSSDSHCVASFATASPTTSTANVLIRFGINSYSSGSGQINANGSGQCAFGTFSDERLKENITNLPSQWDNIKNLRPVEFDFIESQGGEHQVGFIAQEFETVYPDSVASQPMFVGANAHSDEERLTITGWSKTEARLVKALQEAIAKIETLEAQNADLLSRVAALEG